MTTRDSDEKRLFIGCRVPLTFFINIAIDSLISGSSTDISLQILLWSNKNPDSVYVIYSLYTPEASRIFVWLSA